MKKSLEQLLVCAKRELDMRGRVYPKWIAAGKLSEAKAEHELDCMAEICLHLEKLKLLKEAGDEMLGPK